MKVLNFSVSEILPSLLDKSKTQTIRLAWWDKGNDQKEVDKLKESLANKGTKIEKYLNKTVGDILLNKPPRFKVGEEVKLLWKQRSKSKIFFRYNGEEVYDEFIGSPSKVFNKHLGNVKIIEVYKIGMNKECYWHIMGGLTIPNELAELMAKDDGFSSAEQMFSTLDKLYDLSESKEFYVYRWKWDSNKGENNEHN